MSEQPESERAAGSGGGWWWVRVRGAGQWCWACWLVVDGGERVWRWAVVVVIGGDCGGGMMYVCMYLLN